VKEGEIFGLVGMSGGGKTTLSKMISESSPPLLGTPGSEWETSGWT